MDNLKKGGVVEENLKCEVCGEEKEDVKENVQDPYMNDIYCEEVLITICDDCYNNKLGDI